jgi:hypothetical protein
VPTLRFYLAPDSSVSNSTSDTRACLLRLSDHAVLRGRACCFDEVMDSAPRHTLGHWTENANAARDEPRVAIDWGIEIEASDADDLVKGVAAVRRLTERGTYEHLCRCYISEAR